MQKVVLLDTSVVVDFLRGHREATRFVSSLDEKPAVSAVTVSELFAGIRSQKEEKAARSFLDWCAVLTLLPSMGEKAGAYLRHFRASHGTALGDALFAAAAEHHGLQLATLNVKHFPMFQRLKAAY